MVEFCKNIIDLRKPGFLGFAQNDIRHGHPEELASDFAMATPDSSIAKCVSGGVLTETEREDTVNKLTF